MGIMEILKHFSFVSMKCIRSFTLVAPHSSQISVFKIFPCITDIYRSIYAAISKSFMLTVQKNERMGRDQERIPILFSSLGKWGCFLTTYLRWP